MKKTFCIIMALLMIFCCTVSASAAAYGDEDELEALRGLFADGVGPETNGISLDYAFFAPDDGAGEAKHPLVIWLHGMGEGAYPRAQLVQNNFVYWAGPEFQARFVSGGAYLLAVRSPEEKGVFWTSELIEPLMAVIEDFISSNSENIDLGRIYIGGFSMGGKMTLRMAVSYPEMFAAIFPVCPASGFSEEQLRQIKDIPMWLTVSKRDVIAGFYTYSQEIWDTYCSVTEVPDESRLSLIDRVCYPNGKKTLSNHHAWFAVTYDMFTEDGGDYYNMTTVNASGDSVALSYPDGMISWLSAHSSNYGGDKLTPSQAVELSENQLAFLLGSVPHILRAIVAVAADMLTSAFAKIFGAQAVC